MALLLVKLHLEGFYWGDVSLSNTLFRRDAGAFAAYLVDAETGVLHPGGLSDGQRDSDLEIARVNVAGELLDLQAGNRLDDEIDPVEMAGSILEAYHSLWETLTGQETFDRSERWRIRERIDRLNDLGFDIEELSMSSDESGTTVSIQPKVVRCGPPPTTAHSPDGHRCGRKPSPTVTKRPRLLYRHLLPRPRSRRGDGRPRVAHPRV